MCVYVGDRAAAADQLLKQRNESAVLEKVALVADVVELLVHAGICLRFVSLSRGIQRLASQSAARPRMRVCRLPLRRNRGVVTAQIPARPSRRGWRFVCSNDRLPKRAIVSTCTSAPSAVGVHCGSPTPTAQLRCRGVRAASDYESSSRKRPTLAPRVRVTGRAGVWGPQKSSGRRDKSPEGASVRRDSSEPTAGHHGNAAALGCDRRCPSLYGASTARALPRTAGHPRGRSVARPSTPSATSRRVPCQARAGGR